MPADVSPKSGASIVGSDRLEVERAAMRILYENPPADRVDIDHSPTIASGADLDVTVTAGLDFGTTVVVEIVDSTLAQLHQQTTQSTDATLTFTNVDTTAAFVRAWVENGSNNRVSERAERPLTVGDLEPHPSLPSYGEPRSDLDRALIEDERFDERTARLDQLAGIVWDLYRGHHAGSEGESVCRNIERHIDLIVGLAYGRDPLKDGDVTAAVDDGDTALYPSSHAGDSPITDQWVDPFGTWSTSSGTVLFFNSPGGSRGPGDTSEKQELQNKRSTTDFTDPANETMTVYDETAETDVTYTTDAEVQGRIDEIDQIVNDFNDDSDTEAVFDARYAWIDRYLNREAGHEFQRQRLLDAVRATSREDLVDTLVSRVGS